MDVREQTKAAIKKSSNPNSISLAIDVDITQRQGRLPSHMLDTLNMNSADSFFLSAIFEVIKGYYIVERGHRR